MIARYSPFTRDMYKVVAKMVISEVPSGRILDVGTGPGHLPIAIAKLMKDGEVVGLDISEDMVRMAQGNAEKAGMADKVRFEAANGSKMPFEDAYFDLVVSTGSYHHWKDKFAVINEIYRVLKPGQKAMIGELRKDAPPEHRKKMREQYGWLVSGLMYRAVRVHSSTTSEEFQRVLSAPGNRFKSFEITYPVVFTMVAVLAKT